jgi:uncharacterized membrane protein (UPF0127 family)
VIRRVLLTCVLLTGTAAGCSDGDDRDAAATSSSTTTTVEAPPTSSSTAGDALPAWFSDVVPSPTEPGWPDGSWAPEVRGRTPLAGFGEVAAVITAADGTECEVCLLAALSPEQSSRGLMFVTDEALGGYDGMLFAFEQDISSGFWMRNTRLPLSIAYFDADGVLVSQTDMEPCADDQADCPSYPADGPFRFALEVPQGRLPEVGVFAAGGGAAAAGDAVIELTGTPCPVASGGS